MKEEQEVGRVRERKGEEEGGGREGGGEERRKGEGKRQKFVTF